MSRQFLSRLPHKSLIFLFSFFIFFASHAFADEKENPCAKSLLNLEPPPLIQEVKIQPPTPKDGDDVTVYAAIGNDGEKTKAVTTNAWLHYSTDDGKTETVDEMQKTEEKDIEGFAVWTGKIPAQKTGTNVVYYVSAKDSNGHNSTETPGESANVKFPPEEGKESGIKFSAPVPDEECPSAEGGLDILGFSVGYDEKTIYGKITMRDKITAGTINPVDLRSIVIGFMNPNEDENAVKGSLMIWMPWVCDVGACAYFQMTDWYAVDERVNQTKQPVPDTESGADGRVNENIAYFKIKRLFLKTDVTPLTTLFVFTLRYNQTDLQDAFNNWEKPAKSPMEMVFQSEGLFPPQPADASPHMVVYLRTHAYTVR